MLLYLSNYEEELWIQVCDIIILILTIGIFIIGTKTLWGEIIASESNYCEEQSKMFLKM